MSVRSHLIITAAITGLLAACGPAASDDAPITTAPAVEVTDAEAMPAGPQSAPAQAAQAPRPNEGYDWYTRADMEQGQSTMRLAYEVPETDDQPMGINCLRGSGTLTVDHQSHTAGIRTLVLTSEGVTRTYPVKAEFQEEMDGDYLTVDIPGTDPVLTAFRRTGWLTMTVDGHTQNMVAHRDSGAPQRIDDFFSFCLTQE